MQAMLLMLVVTATGCTSLPNFGPFADATHQLKAAVAQSGLTVSDELRYTESGKETAEQLDEACKARNQAFEAIVAYSDSLEAIVSSGNQGAQAAGELADSIQEFAEAAGVTAHKQVVNALKNSRPVSTTSLLEGAVEIQYLLKRIREL